jgi:hypothetical protein
MRSRVTSASCVQFAKMRTLLRSVGTRRAIGHLFDWLQCSRVGTTVRSAWEPSASLHHRQPRKPRHRCAVSACWCRGWSWWAVRPDRVTWHIAGTAAAIAVPLCGLANNGGAGIHWTDRKHENVQRAGGQGLCMKCTAQAWAGRVLIRVQLAGLIN